MTNTLQSRMALRAAIAAAILGLSAVSFAQSGEAVYKAHCQSCHGATGTPSAGMVKLFSMKPASEYKASAAEEFNSVKNGKGRMKPFAGKLSDAEIKAAVEYFRTLK